MTRVLEATKKYVDACHEKCTHVNWPVSLVSLTVTSFMEYDGEKACLFTLDIPLR